MYLIYMTSTLYGRLIQVNEYDMGGIYLSSKFRKLGFLLHSEEWSWKCDLPLVG